jgi:anti-sigma factor RsiW
MQFTADGHPSDELLSAYLTEAIDDPAVEAAVSAHLAACAACREHIAQLRVITALLAELPAPALPRSFALAGEELQRLRPRPWYLRYQPVFRWASAVAAVLLVALLGIDLLAGGPEQTATPPKAPSSAVERQAAPEAAATPAAALSAPAEQPAGDTGSAGEAAPAETPMPASEATPEAPVAVMVAPETPQPAPATPAPTAAGEAEPSARGIGVSPLGLAAFGVGVVLVIALALGFVVPRLSSRRRPSSP